MRGVRYDAAYCGAWFAETGDRGVVWWMTMRPEMITDVRETMHCLVIAAFDHDGIDWPADMLLDYHREVSRVFGRGVGPAGLERAVEVWPGECVDAYWFPGSARAHYVDVARKTMQGLSADG